MFRRERYSECMERGIEKKGSEGEGVLGGC